MNEATDRSEALFPDWEETQGERNPAPSYAATVSDFKRMLRDMVKPETGGLVSLCQAARILGLSESYVRKLCGRQVIRRSHYPALGLNLCWGGDVKAVLDARAAKRKEKP